MQRLLNIIIESNLFIAISAVCFMRANVILLDLTIHAYYYLSAQLFFSALFIYQISRWIYYKNDEYSNKEELILKWYQNYPILSKASIYFSGIAAFIFFFFLQIQTQIVLLILGIISITYPLQILKPFGVYTRLRDFPFIKIFLIAFVWSISTVVLPYTESQHFNHFTDQTRLVVLMLFTQYLFILFITIPFDINDAKIDKLCNIKTIPSVIGVKTSKIIAFMIGIIYAVSILFMFMLINWNHMPNKYLSDWTISLIWLMLIALQIFTFLKSDTVSKGWIKLVYDGSMIVYFLIVFFTVK